MGFLMLILLRCTRALINDGGQVGRRLNMDKNTNKLLTLLSLSHWMEQKGELTWVDSPQTDMTTRPLAVKKNISHPINCLLMTKYSF